MSMRRLPAEWEPQSGVMLTWPHEDTGWTNSVEKVDKVFSEISSHISQFENVLIVAKDTPHQKHIQSCLESVSHNAEHIIFAFAKSNDSWARDHGAITILENEQPLLLDFLFNGWGKKYPFQFDNKINFSLKQQNIFNSPMESVDFILEGGSIESDGNGTLLTTNCLLSENRNEGWARDKIETELKEQLGVSKIHWLNHGMLLGDDTDAHIDTLARFITEDKITYVQCKDPADPHFESLQAMEQELAELKTLGGEKYNLVPLPLPHPITNTNGDRLPATYANFSVINNAVLLPVYHQATDDIAASILEECFPGRRIIPINCLPLIDQFGSLHCVTMQFPANVLMN